MTQVILYTSENGKGQARYMIQGLKRIEYRSRRLCHG